MAATCGGCETRWTGSRMCHCSGCHETFSSARSFDHHRVGYKCADPAQRGLIDHGSMWRFPAT